MTAAWRQQLQKASFRGVGFHVTTADSQEGRRGVLFEYPQRDDPFVEDMGRKAGEFTLEAFVLGDDYFKARDALRDALRKPGPGELVHPTLGRMQVALTAPYRMAESLVDKAGMARFTINFVESGINVQPAARADTSHQVDTAADGASLAAEDDFGQSFDVDGKPEFVAQDALGVLGEALGALDGARAGLVPDMSILGSFVGELGGVSGSLSSLIRSPLSLASRIMGLFGGLRSSFTSPLDALRALSGFFSYSSTRPPVPLTTPSRLAQAANVAAVESLVRRAAIIESARAVTAVDFAATAASDRVSYQEAVALRESLADALESEAAAAPAATYNALTDLRVAVVRDITARGADLPRLSTITTPSTLPALVVSYRAFGDARRADEIVARNAGIVRHPGFVAGGVPLEVLANG
ncbi:MAG: DNA circularization N-terminal domain-containing protein [Rhodocyclaceae bacterium]|nr:DNA circularization N-terminal domain-containing protein [Rhodocyclaceae bacterium]